MMHIQCRVPYISDVMEQRGFYFPHVFVFIAWLLLIGSMAASTFFVLLFSTSWGKQKSEEWLTSFVMSLFESVTFVDPIMVSFLLFTNVFE